MTENQTTQFPEHEEPKKLSFLGILIALERFFSPERLKESTFLKLFYLFCAIAIFLLPILLVFRPYGFEEMAKYKAFQIPDSIVAQSPEEEKNILSSLQKVLETKKINEIQKILETLPAGIRQKDLYKFLAGYVELSKANYAEAIKNFDMVTDGQPGEDARWYAGMAYLKLKDGSAAMEKFLQIVQMKGLRAGEAKKIIEEIKKWDSPR